MASISFSVNRGTLIDTLGAAGSQTVTEGTDAISTGDLELIIDGTKHWTKKEIKQALDVIWRYLTDPTKSTSVIL